MDDSKQTNLALLDRRLDSLRHAILERPMPGIDDARIRSNRVTVRRPLQVAVFVIGIAVLIAIPVIYEGGTSGRGTQPAGRGTAATLTLSQKIDRIAQKEGAFLGDPVITSDHWVATDAGTADRTLGGTALTQGTAYLIEITGSFSGVAADGDGLPGPNSCKSRPPSPFAYFVADDKIVATGLVEVTATTIDLARFGEVHSDTFSAPPGASIPTTSSAKAQCMAEANAVMAAARAFLSLESAGGASTFTVTYTIPAGKNGGTPVTLTVAHEPSAGSSPSAGDWPQGIWMFKVQAGAPGTDFWVTRPNDTTECMIPPGYTGIASGWSCSQIAQDQGGNGWIMATAAYEPNTVLDAMQSLVSNATASQIALSNSTVAGQPVECLTVRARATAAACITSSGALASFATPPQLGVVIGNYFEYGTAVSITSTVSPSLLAIPAKPGPWKGPVGFSSCQVYRGCS
jgi:hypothetical protein